MADTHPNAYLTEAIEKRQSAASLIAEAEALETQANALSSETDPDNETPPADEPDDEDEATSKEETDLADAENTIEGDKAYDQGDPHRHGFMRNKKK